MKVAVSLPDELFAQADVVAERLGLNRSQLYAQALEEFLAGRGEDPVTVGLNELAQCGDAGSGRAAGRRLIDEGAWTW
ncbi:MAG: CopG family ribbon-helix-helix protein [Sporichthyaceae bacterium]